MIQDFDAYVHVIKVKEGVPITLIPFGDIHRSSPNCAEDIWMEFLETAKATKNAYFLGMGDYDDVISATERDILQHPGLHDSTKMSLEDWYVHYTQRLFEEIKFMKGRVIGLIEGNHYANLQSGVTTTQLLCMKLNCRYFGCSAFVRLILELDPHHRMKLDLCIHHGKGAGSTTGASMNTVEKLQNNAEADIYLMGHDHRKSIAMQSRMMLSETRKYDAIEVKQRKIVSARTGSFLKGYVPGKPSYVAQKALRPADLGVIKIELVPRRKHVDKIDKRYIDLHVSL